MRIALFTYGSRGDVQPVIALGVGLKQAGHTPRVVAPAVFADLVGAHGLDFVALPGDPVAMSRQLVQEGRGSLYRVSKIIRETALPVAVDVFALMEEAAADADALVYSFLLAIPAHYLARRHNIPGFFFNLQPLFTPTRELASPMFPESPLLTGAFNRLTHRAYEQIFWQTNRLSYHWVRRSYPHLPPNLTRWPLHDTTHPPLLLYAFSSAVIAPDDWPPHAHITGYWTLDDPGWQPSDALRAFLEAGPPPVYVGFGSMVADDMDAFMQQVIAALRAAGQRGVMLTGWGGARAEQSDDLFVMDSAPHSHLFPLMQAIVHHGGAGTTGAALRAGVPAVVVPFFGDQFFWGDRVHALGVGPAPIPSGKATTESLALAVHTAATYPPMRERAAALGARIQAEDGIANTVALIDARMQQEVAGRD